MNGRVLVAGISTRAAAESAARAGFSVTSLDAFGDLDQHPSVRALSLPRDFGTRFTSPAAARAARTIESDLVAYLSSFENHPSAVGRLAAGRTLWGNPPAVLRRVRDPLLVAQTLGRRGLAVPAVHFGEPGTWNAEPGTSSPWLVKPLASGGGRGVRSWRGGRVPRGCYLQQLVDGTPGSIVFVAAGGRVVPLGITRQLIGEHAFGAEGYRYCGNILEAADAAAGRDAALVGRACALARVVGEEFGLVGVNGIDFVARDGVPYLIEVNPRWTASMELVERAYGVSVFGAHAAACANGELPTFDLARARRGTPSVGKAVLFAPRDVTAGDTRAWLAQALPADPAHAADAFAGIRDVPHSGEKIPAGRPVCTVFASGPDALHCHAALVERADYVYADLVTSGVRVRRA
jgi:predicted ATP-grasp superfamily ATP-dependent carboligase